MKLSVIIPVLNEKSTLLELLNRVWAVSLPGELKKEVLIVDNGSTDGSLEIAKRFADGRKDAVTGTVRTIHCPTRGKGAAVQLGFKECTGDIILIQDGDLEYDVQDYSVVLQPILDGRTQFVLGSRHLSAGNWKIRQFATHNFKAHLLNLGGLFFHGLFNITYGVRLSDPTTMYKVFKKECLKGLTFHAKRFDFDYELLGKLIRSGHKPLEVPISYRSRDFSEGKKVHVLRDPWTWVWAILKFRWAKL
jgi:glycosyltransferase involved in cell wall biosynthesis